MTEPNLELEHLAEPERWEDTLHEGKLGYRQRWNWHYRQGGSVIADSPDTFYHQVRLGSGNGSTWNKVKIAWSKPTFRDTTGYRTILHDRRWPSTAEYLDFYARVRHFPFSACFSAAHLLAHLLLLAGVSPWRVAIASAHHTYGGAPPTARHVYVVVYVNDKWIYLDLMQKHKRPELGVVENIGWIQTVDYRHPFEVIPPPGSCLDVVPLVEREQ